MEPIFREGISVIMDTVIRGGSYLCFGYAGWLCAKQIYYKFFREAVPRIEKTLQKTMENTKLYIKKDKDTKFYPRLKAAQKADYGYDIRYWLPVGMTLSDFQKKKEHIETALQGEVEMYADGRDLYIKAATQNIMEKYDFDPQIIEDIRGQNLGVSLGYTRRGYLTIDIADMGSHIVIGGVTGSGKSVLIRQIITSIMLSYEPGYVEFNLVDLKGGIEMSLFDHSPFIAENGIKTNHGEVLDMVLELQNEMEFRYNVMRQEGVTKFSQLPRSSMPYIFVVFDEYAEISPSQLKGEEKKTAKRIEAKLGKLARQGRAAGIHLLFCTQRPDAKVIDGQIRSNTQVKIALNVASDVDSRVILESVDAARIPPYPGRGIYKYGRDKTEFQAPFLTRSKAEKLLNRRTRELQPEKEASDKVVSLEEVKQKKKNSGGVIL